MPQLRLESVCGGPGLGLGLRVSSWQQQVVATMGLRLRLVVTMPSDGFYKGFRAASYRCIYGTVTRLDP